MPLWLACSRVVTVILKVVLPRSETVMAGTSVDQLSLSATTMTSAARCSRCSRREVRNEREPKLLLALDEQHDADVQVVAELRVHGTEGRDVRHHAGLVVRGAAAVQPVAAQGRLERRRLPRARRRPAAARRGARRASRSACRSARAHGEDRGLAELDASAAPSGGRVALDGGAHDADLVEDPGRAHQVRHGLRAALHVRRVEGRPVTPRGCGRGRTGRRSSSAVRRARARAAPRAGRGRWEVPAARWWGRASRSRSWPVI